MLVDIDSLFSRVTTEDNQPTVETGGVDIDSLFSRVTTEDNQPITKTDSGVDIDSLFSRVTTKDNQLSEMISGDNTIIPDVTQSSGILDANRKKPEQTPTTKDYPFFESLVSYFKEGVPKDQAMKIVNDALATTFSILDKGVDYYYKEAGSIPYEFQKQYKQMSDYFVEESGRNRESINKIINQVPANDLGTLDKIQRSIMMGFLQIPQLATDILATKASLGASALYFVTRNMNDGYVRSMLEMSGDQTKTPEEKQEIALGKAMIDGAVGAAFDAVGAKLIGGGKGGWIDTKVREGVEKVFGSESEKKIIREIVSDVTKYLASTGLTVPEEYLDRVFSDWLSITKDKSKLTTENVSEIFWENFLPGATIRSGKLINKVRLDHLADQWEKQRKSQQDIIQKSVNESKSQIQTADEKIKNYTDISDRIIDEIDTKKGNVKSLREDISFLTKSQNDEISSLRQQYQSELDTLRQFQRTLKEDKTATKEQVVSLSKKLLSDEREKVNKDYEITKQDIQQRKSLLQQEREKVNEQFDVVVRDIETRKVKSKEELALEKQVIEQEISVLEKQPQKTAQELEYLEMLKESRSLIKADLTDAERIKRLEMEVELVKKRKARDQIKQQQLELREQLLTTNQERRTAKIQAKQDALQQLDSSTVKLMLDDLTTRLTDTQQKIEDTIDNYRTRVGDIKDDETRSLALKTLDDYRRELKDIRLRSKPILEEVNEKLSWELEQKWRGERRLAQRQDESFVALNLRQDTPNKFYKNPMSWLADWVTLRDDNFKRVMDANMEKGSKSFAQFLFGDAEGVYKILDYSEELLKRPEKVEKFFGELEEFSAGELTKQKVDEYKGTKKYPTKEEIYETAYQLSGIVGEKDTGGRILSQLMQGGRITLEPQEPLRTTSGTDQFNIEEAKVKVNTNNPDVVRTVPHEESFERIISSMSREEIDEFSKWMHHNRNHYKQPEEQLPIEAISEKGQRLFNEYNRIKNNVSEVLYQRGIFDEQEKGMFDSYEFYTALSDEKGSDVQSIKSRLLRAHTQKSQPPEIIPEFIKTMEDALNAAENNRRSVNYIEKLSKLGNELDLDRITREGGNELGNTLSVWMDGRRQSHTINNPYLISAIKGSDPTGKIEQMMIGGIRKFTGLVRAGIVNFPGFKSSMMVKDLLQLGTTHPAALKYGVKSAKENFMIGLKHEYLSNSDDPVAKFHRDLYLGGGKFAGTRWSDKNVEDNLKKIGNYNSRIEGVKNVVDNILSSWVGEKTRFLWNADWSEDVSRTARAMLVAERLVKKYEDTKIISLFPPDMKKKSVFEKLDYISKNNPTAYQDIIRTVVKEAKDVSNFSQGSSSTLVKLFTSLVPFSNAGLQSANNYYRLMDKAIRGGDSKLINSLSAGAAMTFIAGVIGGMNESGTDTDEKDENKMVIGDWSLPVGFPVTKIWMNTGRFLGNSLRASVEKDPVERLKLENRAATLFRSIPTTMLSSLGVQEINVPIVDTLMSIVADRRGSREGFREFGRDTWVTAQDASPLTRDVARFINEFTNGEININPKKLDYIFSTIGTQMYKIGKSAYEAEQQVSRKTWGDVALDVSGFSSYIHQPSLYSQSQKDYYKNLQDSYMFSDIKGSLKKNIKAVAVAGDVHIANEEVDALVDIINGDKGEMGKHFAYQSRGIRNITSFIDAVRKGQAIIDADPTKTIEEKKKLFEINYSKIKRFEKMRDDIIREILRGHRGKK